MALLFTPTSWGATEPDQWIVVDPESQEVPTQDLEPHHFESLGSEPPQHRPQRPHRQWSLAPKLVLAPALHGSSDETLGANLLGLHSHLQFSVQPTWRAAFQLTALPAEGLMISGSWEFTPQRTAQRYYYGLGAAHKLIAQQQLSNLVDLDQYYLTLQAGYEHLISAKNGIQLEAKTFLGREEVLFQLSIGYLFSL